MDKEQLAMTRIAIGVEVAGVLAEIWIPMRYKYYTTSNTYQHNYSLQATISPTAGQAAARKENLPGMFTFHQNSAKAYLRSSM